MIGTIGSLVQETSHRFRWLLSVAIYSVACVGASLLLGAVLSAVGRALRAGVSALGLHAPFPHADVWLVGLLALAYAASDLGAFRLWRPTLRYSVPITWWRRWRPYGAALAYGASLGFGFMTIIPFGAFYVVCGWLIVRGDPLSGALVMAGYGAARALVMFPASWGAYRHRTHIVEWLSSPLFDLERARRWLAAALLAYGVALILAPALAF
jgi:sulfite exporter TauE/SafE